MVKQKPSHFDTRKAIRWARDLFNSSLSETSSVHTSLWSFSHRHNNATPLVKNFFFFSLVSTTEEILKRLHDEERKSDQRIETPKKMNTMLLVDKNQTTLSPKKENYVF